MDIHNYQMMYETALKHVAKAEISEKNKELILRFNDALILENLSKPRLIKYMDTLTVIARRLDKDLDKVTIDDLKKFISTIQQTDLSPWTKQGYKLISRRFYKWLYQTEDYPPIVKWINIKIHRSEQKLPSEGDMLTEQDIHKLIECADHPRDKAFVSVLWESGARVAEIGNLLIKHVAFDKFGCVISVKGKTGSRKIRLISSTPYLSTWLNNHPFKNNNDFALWTNIGTTNHNKCMNYANIRMRLLNLFKKAGINKRFNPHTFRHSRATFMANHLTEFQMNQYFGWIQGSDMPSTYVHMSGREVDKAILEMNGVKTDDKKEESKLLPKICPRCDTINAFDSKHCNKCGGVIDLKYAMELEQEKVDETKMRAESDKLMTLLLKDKDVQQLLIEKLKGMSVVES